MKTKANLLFLYGQKDAIHLNRLFEKLDSLGIKIYTSEPTSEGEAKSKASIRVVALFVSEQSVNSEFFVNEVIETVIHAKDRSKIIIPIVEYDFVLDKNPLLKNVLMQYNCIFLEDGLHSSLDYDKVVTTLSKVLFNQTDKEMLYEIVNELIQLDYASGVSVNLTKLINIITNEIIDGGDKRTLYKELLKCLKTLDEKGALSPFKEDKENVKAQGDAIYKIYNYFNKEDFSHYDIFLVSLSIVIQYYLCRIACYTIELLTNGDVINNPGTIEQYQKIQKPLYELFHSLFDKEIVKDGRYANYSEDESSYILNVNKYDISKGIDGRIIQSEGAVSESGSIIDVQYNTIAEYIKKTNHLFETIGEGINYKEFLMCLKTSYERLKNYCEIIGYKELCAVCIEKIAEINKRLELSEEQDSDSFLDNSFKALLGFSVAGKDNFDVFISYKHEDVDIATSVYHYLRSELINPFFDTVSLPELSKSEYEDAIMNALEHSNHFVIILSNLDYLNSFWVDLEMKTFRHEMVEGRKPNANFLFIVTNEVFEEIARTNKTCLPIKYRSYEIMKVDSYKESLAKYLK